MEQTKAKSPVSRQKEKAEKKRPQLARQALAARLFQGDTTAIEELRQLKAAELESSKV